MAGPGPQCAMDCGHAGEDLGESLIRGWWGWRHNGLWTGEDFGFGFGVLMTDLSRSLSRTKRCKNAT